MSGISTPIPLLRQKDNTHEDMERRVEKLKASNQETLKELQDAKQKATRLANSLGFSDIFEAQVMIDNADHDVPFKECLERIEELQMQLMRERVENERLKENLRQVEEERDSYRLKAAAAEESPIVHSRDDPVKQLAVLQSKYDALLEVKERAAARYKADYKKWKGFRDWVFGKTDDELDKATDGADRKKLYEEVMMKKRRLMELGPDFDMGDDGVPLPISDISSATPPEQQNHHHVGKENQATPRLEKRKRVGSLIPKSPPPLALLSSRDSTIPLEDISKSKDVSQDTRVLSKQQYPAASDVFLAPSSKVFPPRPPLVTQVNVNEAVKDEPMSSPLLGPQDSPKTSQTRVPNSSDTEDDSQALSFHPSLFAPPVPRFPILDLDSPPIPSEPTSTPRPRPRPRPVNSSSIPTASSSTVTPSKPRPHPLFPHNPPEFGHSDNEVDDINKHRRKRQDVRSPRSQSVDAESGRPQKIRRLTELVAEATGSKPTPRKAEAGSASAPITPVKGRDAQLHTPATAGRIKAKYKDMVGTSTASSSSTQVSAGPFPPSQGKAKGATDYSAYKGRGRYAKDLESKGKTLNAQFVINTEQNAGLDHQYEEVVRKKGERKKMEGVDCECCREYYEALGPLPKGLQPPLWRSPPPTPSGRSHSKSCTLFAAADSANGDQDNAREKAIAEHKQSVSRHRQHWSRGETPPAYWNIAFPSTQEAEEINEQAREMHERKRRELETMARKEDGKYRRR